MSKIFISHSTADGDFATRLMDLLQNQFNLTRDNFFLTSDEELEVGDNWIEEIRKGMEDANIIMPIITNNFLDSQFCLCELGASWINQKALVPIIIPPLDYHALDGTPYRAWTQAITLNSVKDLQRIAEAMERKDVGRVRMVRFTNRAEKFFEESIIPFIQKLEKREVVTLEAVKQLKLNIEEYKIAYEEAEEELSRLKNENDALCKMKDASEIREFEFSKMDEWEIFLEAVEETNEQLRRLSPYVTSIMYHDLKKSSSFGVGFIGEQDDKPKLNALQNEGLIKWDNGWEPDYEHPVINRANNAIKKLSNVISGNLDNILFVEKFESEFEDVRLGLEFTPFWEEVLGLTIFHSR
ncbi:toll/interleukin-1 receptor domain-containing protein [Fictibacillus phosphorivorans]|uniref:toll/interleukin-1 receptor domain-containing protein n=1 Tax=Fictibacillus phosphorivorans TaxID=1221500 RepID=UPI001642DCDD|nr:toll/interleukin-1 receptor domain-containing protein [Fictibacillus phosphorivorans]